MASIRNSIAAALLMSGVALAQGEVEERVRENPPSNSRSSKPVLAPETFVDKVSGLLSGLKVELKAFEGSDEEASLGFGYAFEKSKRWPGVSSAWEFGLEAKGNVAFDDKTNPEDFLSTKARLRWNTGSQLQADGVSFVNPGDAAIRTEMTDQNTTPARRQELVDMLRNDRLFWDLDINLNAGLESNQRFTARNNVLGMAAALDLKNYSDESRWSTFNVFDYPFAVTRWLSGCDPDLAPRGSAIPTLLAGVDLVEPDGDDNPRILAGDDSSYARVHFEVSMKTPFLLLPSRTGDTTRDVLFISLNYRLYFEPDASTEVKDAGLDVIDYFSVAVTHRSGVFVAYRTGELPFDLQSDEAFEVGWSTSF
jgi:hypothetical protein